MQVSVENSGALERRLTIQVPGDEIQQKVETKLRELRGQVRIKGFRPGKVPMSVVKQRYGRQVRLDIVNETMQQSLQQALVEQDLRPASSPRVDASPEGLEKGDLEFSAIIEVYPEIGDLDVAAIELERPVAEVTDADVDEMLETLREQRRTWDDVERKAQKGDRVLIDYSAEFKGGTFPEEGVKRMAIIMGDTGFDDLEKAVASIAPDEEKSVKLKFPEDFRDAELAGQKADTHLKVIAVAEGTLPEVDEEFIKSYGVEDGSLDALKEEIRGNLRRELKQATNTLLKTRLVDELLNTKPDLEVPESIVRQEATSLAAQAVRGGGEQPDPTIVDAFMDTARSRVRAGLLLGELAQQNEIRIDAGKVREAVETIASTYEQPAEVLQLYYGNQQLLQQVESSVLEEQVVDWVLENAKVTPREMKFQDVIADAAKAGRSV
ncbi:MAG: trigger factor [Lysobacterales bacterium]|jgi:trigger factor